MSRLGNRMKLLFMNDNEICIFCINKTCANLAYKMPSPFDFSFACPFLCCAVLFIAS